jgi:serine/threonine protein kinase
VTDSSSPERWRRLERLLDTALDTEPERRASFLDAACAGEDDLRAEIEQLLFACEESKHFLQEPAGEFAAPILASLAAVSHPTAPGARIGPFLIIEEAGRGGMAVVYRAERDDGEFRQRVALKLMRSGVIAEDVLLRRFREERQILASLEHPGIARLIDGGVTESGLPWFAMEYVDGTPIDRYCDERRLSVEARLDLFCAVCDAVQHAHGKRIVHRDLKPANILVIAPGSEGAEPIQVKLLDFGIGKVLAPRGDAERSEPARPDTRLMTPEYASPEQMRGDAVTSAADVYALGVLLYRLLCGRHPYPHTDSMAQRVEHRTPDMQPERPSAAVSRAEEAATGQQRHPDAAAVAAARGSNPEQLRRRLQGDLDAIVLEALSREPGRRYADAGQFAAAVRRHRQGVRHDPADRPAGAASLEWLRQRPRLRGPGAALAAAAATIVLVLVAAFWFARGQPAAMAIDPDVIVVAPFDVAAAQSFDYRSEGRVDLLSTSLNGEAGSRAVDARAALAAWRSAARRQRDGVSPAAAERIARGLGAGQLLMGSVVGTSERLTLSATLHDVARSTVRTRVTASGPADSLLALVDGIVGQLLAREAGGPAHRLAAMTTTSLPALRSYLEGSRDYRSGRFSQAVAHLQEALSHDSTFALGAIHLWLASGWGPLSDELEMRQRALRLAWDARDRLSAPDRLLLESLAGPRYPAPTPRHEMLAAHMRAVNASPDRAEVLARMGDFHVVGVLHGEDNAMQHSAEYFSRALALDSGHAWPAYGVARGAAVADDAATVHRVVRRYLAADSTSEMAHLLAWIDAAVSGDARAIAEVRARMPAMHPTALGWIVFHALLLGRDLDGADAALAALRATVRSDREWQNYRFREWEYLGNRGRLAELERRLEAAGRETAGLGPIDELGMSAELRARSQRALYRIRTALFWAGDAAGIDEALAVMEDLYRRVPAPGGDPFTQEKLSDAACFAGMGRVQRGEIGRARTAVARLHELEDGWTLPNRVPPALCALTLEALIAVAERRPDARARVERADSMMRHRLPSRMIANRTQLLLARAWDALGDPEAGLRVIRRRGPSNPAFFLATILAEEGRLAARVGDRDGAIRAYRHYLALRTEPDPALVPEVERVRAELAELATRR